MNQNKKVNILGVYITPISLNQLNQKIIQHALKVSPKPLTIFKPYVEFMYAAHKNSRIKKTLNSADICVADSIAMQWSASFLYSKSSHSKNKLLYLIYSLVFGIRNKIWINQVLPERMQGINQTLPLFSLADQRSMRIGIFGGPKDTEATKKSITKLYPKISLNVWSGYYRESKEEEIVSEISKFKPDILFCALGFPKQEKFIVKHKNRLNAKVLIGEGGSFDYEAFGGDIKRAPKSFQALGLEWLWRLFIQPKRLKRQLAIPLFIKAIYKQKKSN